MIEEERQNPDKRLREAVQRRLAAHAFRSFLSVRVGVLNGIVHLAGNAPTLEMRQKAAAVVRIIPGVRGVVNRIEAPGAPPPARPVDLNLGETNDKDPE